MLSADAQPKLHFKSLHIHLASSDGHHDSSTIQALEEWSPVRLQAPYALAEAVRTSR